MRRFIELFSRFSADTRSVFKLVGGTAAAQAVAILLTPIMTRLYSPEVYGEISVLLSITGIASIVICLRYDPAIVLPERDEDAYSLYRICLLVAAVFSVVIGLGLAVFNTRLFALLNAPNLAHYWVFVPVILLATGVANAGNYWLIRKNQFGIVAKNAVISTFGATVPAILLGLAGYATVFSRVISTTLGILLWMGYILTMTSRNQKAVKGQGTLQEGGGALTYRRLLGEYRVFLLFDVWSTLANTLSWQIVPILMNSVYSPWEAGQYALGLRMIQVPMSLIGSAISQVFFRTASERRAKRTLYPYLRKMARRLFLLSVIPTIIIGLSGKWLFVLVFGGGWETAGLYSQILAPWAILWLVASSLSPIFMVLKAQKLLLAITLMNLVLRVAAIYLGAKLGGAVVGVALFSVAGIIIYGIVLLTSFYLARKSDQAEPTFAEG